MTDDTFDTVERARIGQIRAEDAPYWEQQVCEMEQLLRNPPRRLTDEETAKIEKSLEWKRTNLAVARGLI